MANVQVVGSTGGESNVSGGMVCGMWTVDTKTDDLFIETGFDGSAFDIQIFESADHDPMIMTWWTKGMTVGNFWMRMGTGDPGAGTVGNEPGGPYFGADAVSGKFGLILPVSFMTADFSPAGPDISGCNKYQYRIYR